MNCTQALADRVVDYRTREDETVASRGSISMKNAVIKEDRDKKGFDVSTTGAHSHSSAQKWYLKANHPVEASRWIEAIKKSIEWSKTEASPIDERRRPSGESYSSGRVSVQSGLIAPTMGSRKVSRANRTNESLSNISISPSHALEEPPRPETEEEQASSSSESSTELPPHENFELNGNAILAQMELLGQVLNQPGTAPGVRQSFTVVQDMINEYTQMVRERDAWWKKQIKKEKEALAFWEESLMTVVKEGEGLEQELKARSRRRGSRVFGPSRSSISGLATPDGTVKRRGPARAGHVTPPTATPAQTVLETPKLTLSEPHPDHDVEVSPPATAVPASLSSELPLPPLREEQLTSESIRPPARSATTETLVPPKPLTLEQLSESAVDVETETEEEEAVDSEDEFFDAIEANNLPNLIVPEPLKSPGSQSIVLAKTPTEPYVGYANLRSRLRLKTDERPNTSLWSVLKHSIGKDLTKISFPVFFNEPTSMLQRMVRRHVP